MTGKARKTRRRMKGKCPMTKEDTGGKRRSRGRRNSASNKGKSKKGASPKKGESSGSGLVEYEYLIKYKGRSYLHLEWKSGGRLGKHEQECKRYLPPLPEENRVGR